jgi:hypothetical protein
LGLVVAIEPDQRQAAILRRLAKERVRAELVLVDSKDAAIGAINARVPDLILVTALLSPRDEEELVGHLKTLDGAEHLQTLTIPQLAGPALPDNDNPRGLLGAFRRKRAPVAMPGCDPSVFAEEIVGYLRRAQELKAEWRALAEVEAQRRSAEAERAAGLIIPASIGEEPSYPAVALPADNAWGDERFVADPITRFNQPNHEAAAEPLTPAAPPAFEMPPEPADAPDVPAPVAQPELVTRPERSLRGAPPDPFADARAAGPEGTPEVIEAPAEDRAWTWRTEPAPAAPPRVIERPPLFLAPAPVIAEPPAAAAESAVEPAPSVEPAGAAVESPVAPAVAAPAPIEDAPPPFETAVPERIGAAADDLVADMLKGAERAAEPPEPKPRKKVRARRVAQVTEKPRPVPPPIPIIGPRLTPLAIWARMEAEDEPTEGARTGRTADNGGESDRSAADEIRQMAESRRMPVHVWAVSYPRGCRIRRVRVPHRETERRKGDPTVILSKKLLQETRAGGRS